MASRPAVRVHSAIDFDDEAARRADDIRDVTTDDELPTEGDAEAAATKLGPQQLLRERRVVPQVVSASFELTAAPSRLTLMTGR